MRPYWSIGSLLFYIFLAMLGIFCLSRMQSNSKLRNGKNLLNSGYTNLWILGWVFFAVFRLVKPGIGGSDAVDYIEYFRDCNTNRDDLIMLHTGSDLLFRYINKIIRYFTSNYHIYFLVLYTYMTYTYIQFVHKFSYRKFCIIPFFLIFYLYLRGYTSIRSNLSIAFILMSLVSFLDKNQRKAYLYIILACLTHKMAIVFSFVLPFIHFFENRKINIIKVIPLIIIAVLFVSFIRDKFVDFARLVDLGGSYGSYVEIAMDNKDISWVNSLGQAFLAIIFLFFNKRIKNEIYFIDDEYKKRAYQIIYLVCLFDIIMMPVNEMLGIYRGYEYFYIPRLSMYSFLIYILCKGGLKNIKPLIYIILFLLFACWFSFRLSRTYEDSMLMPYIFSL